MMAVVRVSFPRYVVVVVVVVRGGGGSWLVAGTVLFALLAVVTVNCSLPKML